MGHLWMSGIRKGIVSDHANHRITLTHEFNALVAQQNRAVKDATFGGWDAEALAAYEERGKRIAALRAELFPLDGSERRII
jgi:hypothetical protein